MVPDSSESGEPPISREELLELIIDSSADFAIFTVDQHGTTSSWNIGAERLFGYTETEIGGAKRRRDFHPGG